DGEEFLAGLRIPHIHQMLPSAGEALAVGAVGHAFGTVESPLEGEEHLAGLRIPRLHLAWASAAGQAFAVWAEDHAVALEREQLLSGLRIPNLHRPIAIAGQAFAIRAKGQAEDIAGVPWEGEEFLAGLRIPHLHLTLLDPSTSRAGQ